MRTAVLILAGFQAVLLLAAVSSLLFGGADPAGQALGEAYTTLATIAVAVFVVPAIVLALKNRLLPLALALSLAAPLALATLIAYAI
jgi:hypothetical protein